MLKIKYHDRKENKTVVLSVDASADVVEIQVPALDDQPALRVNVNTDAVIVHSDKGLVAMHEFSDMLAEAESDPAYAGEAEALRVRCAACGRTSAGKEVSYGLTVGSSQTAAEHKVNVGDFLCAECVHVD